MDATERASLERQLAELQAARHQLLIGKAIVSVQYDNRKVDYKPGDETKIQMRIMEIQGQLGLSRRRAIGVSFGHR